MIYRLFIARFTPLLSLYVYLNECIHDFAYSVLCNFLFFLFAECFFFLLSPVLWFARGIPSPFSHRVFSRVEIRRVLSCVLTIH